MLQRIREIALIYKIQAEIVMKFRIFGVDAEPCLSLCDCVGQFSSTVKMNAVYKQDASIPGCEPLGPFEPAVNAIAGPHRLSSSLPLAKSGHRIQRPMMVWEGAQRIVDVAGDMPANPRRQLPGTGGRLPGQAPETIQALFGTSLAGGVFVPVNPLLKAEQVAYILQDCNVRILVTSADRLAAPAREPGPLPGPAHGARGGRTARRR
jgi:hypothetical protein